MKRLLVLAFCISFCTALAGERVLGRIVSNGSDATNCTTVTNDGGAGPFYVPRNALLTIQCDSPFMYVVTDQATAVNQTNGVLLQQWQAFPTSTSSETTCTATQSDGGVIFTRSAVVRINTQDAGVDGGCTVWERKGNE